MGAIKLNSKFKELYTSQSRYIYLWGGRGGAKSFTVADFIVRLSFQQGQKILYTRYTLTAANKSIIPEFESKLDSLGCRDAFYVTKDKIVNKATNVPIIFSGIKTSSGNQTARLKSIPGITTWIYEEFEEHPDRDSFEDIDFTIRKKGIQNRIILISNALHKKKHWQYKRFFEGDHPNVTTIYTTYLENLANLNPEFIKQANRLKEKNPKKYERKFLGHHYTDSEHALWQWEMIDNNRLDESPFRQNEYDRIVVAIDPAVTSNKNSDETGIMVTASEGRKGYVLEDVSGRYSPNEWANKAIAMYNKYDASRIIGEVNNGGDMIESTIKNQDANVSYKSVRASRGKKIRAEPIASLYEDNRIHHIGYFPECETELTTWEPGDDSPNRLDALVWGMTELFGNKKKKARAL
jgi:PBSX family phage terminase large subunit